MATKPPVLPVWGETNTSAGDMVQPTNPQIQTGWPGTTTPPSRQRFNWILNFLMNAVRYFSRRGVPDFDAAETYESGDVARGSDGLLYRSIQNTNLNHAPPNASWWAPPAVPKAAADDNTSNIASTSYVLGQISVTFPAMDGVAAVGTSLKFARADHVHPSDSSKANTSGSYGSMSVGSAAFAATAPWSGISGKPTTVGGFGISDAIHTGNIGSQSVAFATSAGRARPRRSDNVDIDFIWSGQSGQPSWLLGSIDGVNFYVWNPSNFSVAFANQASVASTPALGTQTTAIATAAFCNPSYSASANGWNRLSSGLFIMWGTFVAAGNTSTTVSFPTSFASFSRVTVSGAFATQAAQDNAPGVTASTASNFTVWNANDNAITCHYMAVGF